MKTLATLLWLWMCAVPRVAEVTHGHVAREHVIQVSNAAPYYAPATITIVAGETVHWRNAKHSDTHSVREASHGAFSIDIPPGGGVSHQFRRAGEYQYRCRYHPWMAGRIVVRPKRLAVQWQAVPETLRNGRIAGGEGRAWLIGAGARPSVARLEHGAMSEPVTVAHPVDPGVAPAATGDALWFAGEAPGTLVRHGGDSAAYEVAGNRITALAASGDSVWISDGSRIGRFGAGRAVQWIAKSDAPLTMMRAGRDGLLWLRDENGRMGLLRGAAVAWMPFEVSQFVASTNAVWALQADRNKVLNIHRNGGVLEFTIPPSLGVPSTLIVDADTLWIVSERGSVARLSDGELEEYEMAAPAGTVTSAAALWLLDGAEHRIASIQPEVRTLARLP